MTHVVSPESNDTSILRLAPSLSSSLNAMLPSDAHSHSSHVARHHLAESSSLRRKAGSSLSKAVLAVIEVEVSSRIDKICSAIRVGVDG